MDQVMFSSFVVTRGMGAGAGRARAGAGRAVVGSPFEIRATSTASAAVALISREAAREEGLVPHFSAV